PCDHQAPALYLLIVDVWLTLLYSPIRYTLITPSVLRVESEEMVAVEAHGHHSPMEVVITVHDFPQKKRTLALATASLNPGNGMINSTTIKVPAQLLQKDAQNKQYVYIQAKSSQFTLEKVLLLSFHSGYIFIQTDKTIYTPGSTGQSQLHSALPAWAANSEHFCSLSCPLHFAHKGLIFRGTELGEVIAFLGTVCSGTVYRHLFCQPCCAAGVGGISMGMERAAGRRRVVQEEGWERHFSNLLSRYECQHLLFFFFLNRKSTTMKVWKTQSPSPAIISIFFFSFLFFNSQGSDMVEAEKSGIHIVTSPYKILLHRSATYFKPGLPFNLLVSVENADGSPAPQIPVRSGTGVSGLTQADGTVQLALNTPADTSQLSLKVHRGSFRASAVLALVAYKTQGGSRNYLHISVPAAQLQPGNALPVSFSLGNSNADVQKQIHYFTYLILNKGKIIRAGRQARQPGQSLVTILLPITPDLIPSFRIVAYYHVGQKEIVADSVWVDVQDSCMGTLKVTGATEQDNAVQVPGGKMNLHVKGDPGARVGLVAVDKAVYVLNRKYKFSQAKIWDTVEKSDIGCTPGSGQDNVGVFADAGLMLQTNIGIETPQRAGDWPARPRRSLLISGRKAAKARQYASQHLRKCCEDGMQENPMGYSCDRRAKYILEGNKCVQAFLDCCEHIFSEPLGGHRRVLFSKRVLSIIPGPRGSSFCSQKGQPQAPNPISSAPVSSRLASKTVPVYLEDSITTWEVLAVSLSKTRGICVADPYEITVMKQFFIDLRLPYSVVRNEQVAIRAVLYNYSPRALQIRVELMYNEKVCSSSRRDSRFQQELAIQAGASHAVSYVIIPLELGEVEIEVRAAVQGVPVADGVKKKLRVVRLLPTLERSRVLRSLILVPLAAAGEQLETVGPVDMSNVVPNTEPVTFISVKGNIVGDTVENSIDGANLKHLIQVPAGCGEQNMIGMTPAVIATHYLDASRQWERLGVERRAEAIKFITRGYTQQLAYRKADNSYAAFTNRPASTWLTAYVVKVFALAYDLIAINPEVLCGAVKWLILEKQRPDGGFQEDAPVIHGEMVGGYQGSEPDASLTAFVVIAMVEARDVCQQFVESLGSSITKAGDYLARRLNDLKKPYSVAITSYALALLGHAEVTERLLALATGGTHWADPQSRLFSIESTSYALLALLKQKKLEPTGPIVQWLTEQRYYGGGYGSTQATIMVFQALAQYQMDVSESQDVVLDVSINLPGRSRSVLWRINKANAMTKLTDGFTISAKGHGKGTLSVRMASADLCQWPLQRWLLPGCCFPSQIPSASARFLGEVDSTMTILDVSMPTGFSPDMDDLDKLTNRVDKYISKFELDTDLSERGSLILYLDKVSSRETECLKFKAHQHFEVGLIQPAAVAIYEYYALENRCTKFYHPTQESGLLNVLCEEDACRCMEGKGRRLSLPSSPPVYKTQLVKAEQNGMYNYFTMRIVQVIKEGNEQGVQGKTRRFISPVACKATLNLMENRNYLIWGLSSDLWDLKTETAYLLGSSSWIELWPNSEECQQGHLRPLCKGLEEFAKHLLANGCPS
uniref:Uncharacterized protein n=1 Tax=Pelusios castaneus TaxID=367368 RepID=A0A8C8STP1_9SAUR